MVRLSSPPVVPPVLLPASGLSRRGLLFVLSSPSGAGKSTIARRLLAAESQLRLSVSVTTRPPRPGETDGTDYHFVSDARFDAHVTADDFLEWARVFGNRYGTLRAPVDAMLADGLDMLFDIDWQGTQQLHQRAGRDVCRVFILPPSVDELHRRLARRGTDSAEVIAARMARARDEIGHWHDYDYVVINDDLDRCFGEVRTILAAERLKRERQLGLVEFTRRLMD